VGEALGILDSTRAAKLSGAMFNLLRGGGATLSRALTQFGLDANADAFVEVRPPTLVSSETLTATGQLPKFADDAYHLERDDLWAIPTGEVPLTTAETVKIDTSASAATCTMVGRAEPRLPLASLIMASSFPARRDVNRSPPRRNRQGRFARSSLSHRLDGRREAGTTSSMGAHILQ